jgi:minor extracellular serine protease Vpr
MKKSSNGLARLVCVALSIALIANSFALDLTAQETGVSKLSPELQLLVRDAGIPTRSAGVRRPEGNFTDKQMADIFGIDSEDQMLRVTVSITVTSPIPTSVLDRFGASVVTSFNDRMVVSMPLSAVEPISRLREVGQIRTLTRASRPTPSRADTFRVRPRTRGSSASGFLKFPNEGLTGKGVIIGIIDSGIDWRHPDFLKTDGTSRILAIWDLEDKSFELSNGRVGSRPPIEKVKGVPFGTVYTNEQINKAINYEYSVNSKDIHGHGTAVAGIAASNGKASPRGMDFSGIAPESDLIVVRASDCGGFQEIAGFTAGWMMDFAESLNRPIVVNMSFGSMHSMRDGSNEEELFLDTLVGPGKKGRAITVSAGNEGMQNVRAVSRFGRKGQPDESGSEVSVAVSERSPMFAIFDSRDSWALDIYDRKGNTFASEDKQVVGIRLSREKEGAIAVEVLGNPTEKGLAERFRRAVAYERRGDSDILMIAMPKGDFILIPTGLGESVASGRVDFYSFGSLDIAFGLGVVADGIVGSPGNATNVISVGSYVAQTSWIDATGNEVSFNQQVGGISSFSSPGFRRDGIVKPDIVGPGQWLVGSLSSDAALAAGCEDSMAKSSSRFLAMGEQHLYWDGTSASSPFVAGVIALMLEKNPTLDSAQIMEILRSTADKGGEIGEVPNRVWGWGRINPAAALRATPVRIQPQPTRR